MEYAPRLWLRSVQSFVESARKQVRNDECNTRFRKMDAKDRKVEKRRLNLLGKGKK